MAAKKLPRGIRNNNPGNIEIGPNKWQGKVPKEQNTDGRFEQFVDMTRGVRALARTLLTYEKKGFNTVAKIIGRWAPTSENNTILYIEFVASKMRVDPQAVIDIDDYEIASQLVKAIIQKENGLNNGKPWVSDEVIREGLFLAGISGTPQRSKDKERAAVIGGAGAVTAVIPWDQIATFSPLLQTVVEAAPWVLGVALAGAAVYFAYKAYKTRKTYV